MRLNEFKIAGLILLSFIFPLQSFALVGGGGVHPDDARVTTNMFIVAYDGDDVPDGWFPCDGNNGTPDLRSNFLAGAYEAGDLNLGEPGNKGGVNSNSSVQSTDVPSDTFDLNVGGLLGDTETFPTPDHNHSYTITPDQYPPFHVVQWLCRSDFPFGSGGGSSSIPNPLIVNNPIQDLFDAIIIFFISFWFINWKFKKR